MDKSKERTSGYLLCKMQVSRMVKWVRIYYSNNMGELRSRVRYAIHRYLNEELTGERFKGQISEVIHEFEKRLPKKLVCQDVGLIVQEREQSILGKSDEFKRLWVLLDQVEPMIREALNYWKEAMGK